MNNATQTIVMEKYQDLCERIAAMDDFADTAEKSFALAHNAYYRDLQRQLCEIEPLVR